MKLKRNQNFRVLLREVFFTAFSFAGDGNRSSVQRLFLTDVSIVCFNNLLVSDVFSLCKLDKTIWKAKWKNSDVLSIGQWKSLTPSDPSEGSRNSLCDFSVYLFVTQRA